MRTERVQVFAKWTEEEDKILSELMARGASMSEKADALKRRTVDAIKRRQDRLKNPDNPSNKGGKKPLTGRPVGRPKKDAIPPEDVDFMEYAFKPKEMKNRKCLTCGVQFMSEGPHNRLCPSHRFVSSSLEYSVRFR